MNSFRLLLALILIGVTAMAHAESGSGPEQSKDKPAAQTAEPTKAGDDKDSCCDGDDKNAAAKGKDAVPKTEPAKSAEKPATETAKG